MVAMLMREILLCYKKKIVDGSMSTELHKQDLIYSYDMA